MKQMNSMEERLEFFLSSSNNYSGFYNKNFVITYFLLPYYCANINLLFYHNTPDHVQKLNSLLQLVNSSKILMNSKNYS